MLYVDMGVRKTSKSFILFMRCQKKQAITFYWFFKIAIRKSQFENIDYV